MKISQSHSLDVDFLTHGVVREETEKRIRSGIPKGENFAERFRLARRKFGSMQKLADAVGVSRQTIQTWETKPPAKINQVLLQKAADIMGVSAQILFLGSNRKDLL